MREINFSADRLIDTLLEISGKAQVCLLDSCGVNHLDSRLLIAGVNPIETFQITNENPVDTLRFLDEKLSQTDSACIFTISYDFGLKLENIEPRQKEFSNFPEPDVFLARFDCLIIHDYNENKTFLAGDAHKFDTLEKLIFSYSKNSTNSTNSKITSNFTRTEYLAAIEKIKESIRSGDTYQTNLTQQIRARLPENLTAREIFRRLRTNHPAPFAAFIKRDADCVVSISPERFFKVQSPESRVQSRTISTSPVKGTRPRGKTEDEDLRLKNELLESEKERAENVMIVDLLRNDIGRICEFGSVSVEKLCDLETHPTLFHLVSTINGKLREDVKFSDIIRAVFPCGSITGAPKISTMRIIDRIETANRGLSMGAIGYSVRGSRFEVQSSKLDSETHHLPLTAYHYLDLSVAIRTMVIRGREAIFNVGGGIVIDSDPQAEYEETLTKARALLKALDAEDRAENQVD
ncbi:MAG TPA: aminodeoxychorismate synthase component I [Pyrinomonadaceae bacterium]|nr:aminodeoxychorismate synthase component I [Pyrinomonadaceae bacterium]